MSQLEGLLRKHSVDFSSSPPQPPTEAFGAEVGGTLIVSIPQGRKPGDSLQVATPAGRPLWITLPVEAAPGKQLEFRVPPLDGATAKD